jgi:2-iminobutanoate/2-iminopropanoate deaminase
MKKEIERKVIHVPENMCEAYDYLKPALFSRGMSIDIGTANLIFVSGTASVGTNGQTLYAWSFNAQARKAFENARAVLKNSNADWKDVVKVTIYIKDITMHYESFNEVRCEYFKEIGLTTYPASTCIEAKLCREDLMVEMDLVAIVKNPTTSCSPSLIMSRKKQKKSIIRPVSGIQRAWDEIKERDEDKKQ